MLRVAKELARAATNYHFTITETHHAGKQDAPSGTALSLKQALQRGDPTLRVEIVSKREGDVAGIHTITARSSNDAIELSHEAFSRRGFAEGAVRAAEWIHGKAGVWEFGSIVGELEA
jgi:4-hydroxy-tetrahydrodipicolinate reductase